MFLRRGGSGIISFRRIKIGAGIRRAAAILAVPVRRIGRRHALEKALAAEILAHREQQLDRPAGNLGGRGKEMHAPGITEIDAADIDVAAPVRSGAEMVGLREQRRQRRDRAQQGRRRTVARRRPEGRGVSGMQSRVS